MSSLPKGHTGLDRTPAPPRQRTTMKQLISISLTIKAYPKHGPSGYMTIPVYLYSEITLQTLYHWCLINHRWYQKDQSNSPSSNIYSSQFDFRPLIRSKPVYYWNSKWPVSGSVQYSICVGYATQKLLIDYTKTFNRFNELRQLVSRIVQYFVTCVLLKIYLWLQGF